MDFILGMLFGSLIGAFFGLMMAMGAYQTTTRRLLGIKKEDTVVFQGRNIPWTEGSVLKALPETFKTLVDSLEVFREHLSEYVDERNNKIQIMIAERAIANLSDDIWALFYILRGYAVQTQSEAIKNSPQFKQGWWLHGTRSNSSRHKDGDRS